MGKDIELAILFADVVGSTKLYEQMGDIKARDCLVRYRRDGKLLAVASIYRDVDSLKEELAMERRVT